MNSTPPRKPKNKTVRAREYLTSREVERLLQAVQQTGRHALRDYTLLLLMYRHGLRVSEAVNLRWAQVDFELQLLYVTRCKNGVPSTQPLREVEITALTELLKMTTSHPYVFVSERGSRLTTRTVHHLVQRAGEIAHLPFPTHPHMLRHATGFYLVNQGIDTRAIQHYLGHRNIMHTVRYTELSPQRFKDFFKSEL